MGFPRGAAGFALVLLRLSVAARLLTMESPSMLDPSWWLVLQAILTVLLLLGALTPAPAALCCGLQIVATCGATFAATSAGTVLAVSSTFSAIWLMAASPMADALALLLLGPGGYSLDARAFGRRRLVLTSGDDAP